MAMYRGSNTGMHGIRNPTLPLKEAIADLGVQPHPNPVEPVFPMIGKQVSRHRLDTSENKAQVIRSPANLYHQSLFGSRQGRKGASRVHLHSVFGLCWVKARQSCRTLRQSSCSGVPGLRLDLLQEVRSPSNSDTPTLAHSPLGEIGQSRCEIEDVRRGETTRNALPYTLTGWSADRDRRSMNREK